MPAAPTPASRLRERLRTGAPIVGTFVKLAALETIDIASSAGLDLVIVDGEHAQLDQSECLALVRHAAALGLPSIVRIPAVDAGYVNRLLEAGAAGIQLSSLRPRRQSAGPVPAPRFPPER